ncbi:MULTISPECIES: ABC transporter ATP-binding protein [Actibacterium]|uniref:Glutathione import ATP-binding protein GsiA n=1 Tax=Actibacterium naphthalenivorans TaxID=1614693 RepID=A0A840C979_9RHOB|nr:MULTISPECIES: ABC transporter ATP-binding protein [Actibacterium]ALG89031.1 ABC transporter ATP-binding protein [Actibacterium sp. EMB200-NS6]MBB4021413.1 peptide/nickel transport system ATP-binding protein/glutathione transport system ATP-binding protein [Actibacterium naphthalenivorans]
MSLPVLSIRDLKVRFGAHEAVKGISFDIAAGETLALVGESGSGKSATALSILRLIEREGGRIAGGSITLSGTPPLELTSLPEPALQRVRGNRISMIFQEPMTSLNPVMNVGSQLAEVFVRHQAMTHRQALEAARAGLEKVRIPDPARRLGQYPHELSGGLRQRVMIAMALACRPELLIADEPSTALDVTTQAEILHLIRALQADIGMAVLFITHDMGVVAEMADHVVVMKHGQVVEEAAAATLFARPCADYSRRLMAATPRLGAGSPAPIPRPEPVLEVRNLSTRFASRQGLFNRKGAGVLAVRDVSLTLGRGETLGLVGESGCGKSTLARSILRLIEPSAGEVRIMGADITALTGEALRPMRRAAQMIFQDPYASLNPRHAVRDLVTEPARLHGLASAADRRDLAVSLVERVGLEADAVDRFPHQFSGGQRQRLCIARALSVRPGLIIADEPVSALDVSIARQVTDLMLDLQRADDMSFLFISHDIAVVERVSHRIAVMYGGQIVEMGPSQQVLRNPRHSYTRRLLAAVLSPDPARRRAGAAPGAPLPGARAPEAEPAALHEAAPGHFVRPEAA